jgi:hypothetical protein
MIITLVLLVDGGGLAHQQVLFGTWEESFQLLYSWKEVVLQKSPDSVIEIDV